MAESRPSHISAGPNAPWKDPSTLDQLYRDEGLSTRAIGNRLGCSHATVQYWMEKLDIDSRPARCNGGRGNFAPFRTRKDGYEYWTASDGDDTDALLVHRLLAVSEFGFDAVCDMHVHHRNRLGWDNRPDNIEVMTPGDHARHHLKERQGGDSE